MARFESFISERLNGVLRRASRDHAVIQDEATGEHEGSAAAELSRSIPDRATSVPGESTNLKGDRNDSPMMEGMSK
jgi:hypothetical protein